MGYKYRNTSRKKKREFAEKMNEIFDFCKEKGIVQSTTGDSYYFSINGINYRVSNHSIESSNARAFDEYGNQLRDKYHEDQRRADTIYIHASKTRIIEIYTDLENGFTLNNRGERI